MKTERYEVIHGIFEGHVFNGYPRDFGDEIRIIDADSVGRSYPEENCLLLYNQLKENN